LLTWARVATRRLSCAIVGDESRTMQQVKEEGFLYDSSLMASDDAMR
jgi:hypothetical protein